MKEKVIKILIFIILFNYIFTQFAFAANEGTQDSTGFYMSEEEFNQANDDGTVTGPDNNKYNNNFASTESTAGAVSGVFAKIFCSLGAVFGKIINSFANEGGFIDFSTANDDSDEDFKFLTTEKIVFGKYYLLNANIFKDSDDLKVSTKDGNPIGSNGLAEALDSLRDEVAKWYYIMRLLSLIIGLVTLIYIGIRMAMSTVGQDQAKYKKMLVGWVQSILIIVLLPYIMRICNYVAGVLLDIISNIRQNLLKSGNGSFENSMIQMIYGDLDKAGGFNLTSKVIVFYILMWAEFKFLIMYVKRVFAVSFLTIISPLITITYSIDKAGDGRAQAFGAWFREYFMNIFIQPLHAILYLIFIFTANKIAVQVPAVGIIFLLSLTRAEKIVKTIFNMRGLVSMNTMRLFKKGK